MKTTMLQSSFSEPRFRASRSLRIVGLTGTALGVLTVLVSSLLYARDHEFSLFATYLSDVGNTPGWPGTVFNAGMLIAAPVRYLFLVFLVALLGHCGASGLFRRMALFIGALVVLGSIGTAAVPFSLHRGLHMGSALLYFFGTVVLQSMIAWQEWQSRLPRVLPVLSLAVVLSYFVFATLLSMVGKVEAVSRETPVIWEWAAFVSVMVWLATHSVLLGGGGPGRHAPEPTGVAGGA